MENAMKWDQLLSPVRFGKEEVSLTDPMAIRSEFQRDYDRLIFSSPFRRLQNKTQIFPLPGSVFVHNRLTHSLEVASVGRSLGNLVARELKEKYPQQAHYLNEIGTIVSAASLSHDMGNPPFGHAGEKAISNFFVDGDGNPLKSKVSEEQWLDLCYFEGNANALRLLTHQFNGRRKGGYVLTYATLASLIKYPFDSVQRTKNNKYGYFVSEKETFKQIAKHIGLKPLNDKKTKFARHPLVYLVEAADDIAYQIMDIEDAHRLSIFSTEETTTLLLSFFDNETDRRFFDKKEQVFKEVTDPNEQVAFLRASVINHLVHKAARVFVENEQQILNGIFTGSLTNYFLGAAKNGMETCTKTSINHIYKHRSVIEVEITGYNVLSTLLNEFVHAMFNPDTDYSQKLIALLPLQYQEKDTDDYSRIRAVLDFVSGMTDLYALDLYKLIKGIGI